MLYECKNLLNGSLVFILFSHIKGDVISRFYVNLSNLKAFSLNGYFWSLVLVDKSDTIYYDVHVFHL